MAMKRIGRLPLVAFLLGFAAQTWLGSEAIRGCDSVSIAPRGVARPTLGKRDFAEPIKNASTFVDHRREFVTVRTASQGCSAIVGDVVNRPPDEFSAQPVCAEFLSRTFEPTREPLGRAPPLLTFSN